MAVEPPMVLPTSPGQTTTSDRRFCSPTIAGCFPGRISTAVKISPTASQRVNHIDSVRSPRGPVVRGDDSNVGCTIMAHSTSRGRDVSGGRHNSAIASNRSTTESLAPEGQIRAPWVI